MGLSRRNIWWWVALALLVAQSAFGQEVRYVYDQMGRLIGVVDQLGRTALYEYDAVGNILAIRRRDLTGPVAVALVNPNRGTIGMRVEIVGAGFSATASENEITFNGVPAIVLAASSGSLTTQVPAGATSGVIAVTTPLGSAVSPESFSVLSAAVSPTDAAVVVRKSQQFTATISGSADQRVMWAVNDVEGGNATSGTITPDGLYAAPRTLPTPATIRIRATGVAFPYPSAEVTATVLRDPLLPDCTVSWVGSAGDSLWQSPSNWSTNTLPGAADVVCIDLGFRVTLSADSHSINSLISDGAVDVSGGSLSIAAVSYAFNDFTLNGGTFSGAGDLTISGQLTWTGGAMSGTGATIANGALALSGVVGLDGRRVTTSGTTTWTDTGYVYLSNGAVWTNAVGATFDVQGEAQGVFGSGLGTETFVNDGTLRKTGGTSTTSLNVALTNLGTVEVLSGTLSLQGGGASSGAITVAAGANLAFEGGTTTLTGSVGGPGTVRVSGGTTTIGGLYTVTGPTEVRGGTVDFRSGGPITLAALTLTYGTLTGSDVVTVSGLTTWTGGTISGTGAKHAQGGMALSGGAFRMLDGSALTTSGTTTWTDTGYLYLSNGAVWTNVVGATFDVQGEAQGVYGSGLGTETFVNAGTLRKTGGTGTMSLNVALTNLGTVEVLSGTLNLTGTTVSSGRVTAAAGATLEVSGPISTWTGTLDGAGMVVFAGGAATIQGPYQVTGVTQVPGGLADFSSGSPITLAVLDLSFGILTGSDAVTVSGLTTWTGGTISGTGAKHAQGGMAISGGAGQMLDHSALTTSGTTTWTDTGYVYLSNGAVWTNAVGATFDVQGEAQGVFFSGVGAEGTFVNAGTLRKTGGTNTTSLNVALTNLGTVEVESGTLSLQGGGTSSGAFTVAAGANLAFEGGTTTLTGSLGGPGTMRVSGGTTTIGGLYSVTGPTEVNGGTVDFRSGGPITLAVLDLSFGTLTGSDAVTVSGLTTWTGGTISGTGAKHAQGGMALSGGAFRMLDGSALTTSGTTTWTDTGYVYLSNGAVWTNAVGATFDVQGEAPGVFFSGIGAEGTFNNAGTFTKSGGAGTTTFNGVALTNSGTVSVQRGTLSLESGYTQTADADLTIALGGLAPGVEFGRVAVAGSVNLVGDLNVTLINGFTPSLNDSFAIMTYDSQTGAFTNTNLPALGGGLDWSVIYGATALTLTVVP